MKRISLFAFCIATMLFASCERLFDENSITFPAEGGTLTVGTRIFSGTMWISDYDGHSVGDVSWDHENGIAIATGEWLTATLTDAEGKLTLTALPNTTGKSRTLYVSGMHGDIGGDLRVTQKK